MSLGIQDPNPDAELTVGLRVVLHRTPKAQKTPKLFGEPKRFMESWPSDQSSEFNILGCGPDAACLPRVALRTFLSLSDVELPFNQDGMIWGFWDARRLQKPTRWAPGLLFHKVPQTLNPHIALMYKNLKGLGRGPTFTPNQPNPSQL